MADVSTVPAGHPEKPQGDEGRALLERMNTGKHERLSEWAFDHIYVAEDADALEIGCGGGANLRRLLERAVDGHVIGLDYSELSVETSRAFNVEAVEAGRLEVLQGEASSLPFPDGSFDVVTAFETVYYWDIERSFSEVLRVLKPGGAFLICNEDDGTQQSMHEFAAQIEGMKMYTLGELKAALLAAGFPRIDEDIVEEEHWMVLVARC